MRRTADCKLSLKVEVSCSGGYGTLGFQIVSDHSMCRRCEAVHGFGTWAQIGAGRDPLDPESGLASFYSWGDLEHLGTWRKPLRRFKEIVAVGSQIARKLERTTKQLGAPESVGALAARICAAEGITEVKVSGSGDWDSTWTPADLPWLSREIEKDLRAKLLPKQEPQQVS